MRFVAVLLALATLVVGCKKPEPSFDEKLAVGFAKNGVTISAANGRTTPLPPDALLVFVLRDSVAIDVLSSFVTVPSPLDIMWTDPTQAPTAGADDKYRRMPGDPIIVPLANIVQIHAGNGVKAATLVLPEPVPAQLVKEIRATLTAGGIAEHYRLARTKSGAFAQESLAP